MGEGLHLAVRIDRATGVRYEAGFLEAHGTRMLALTTLPPEPTGRGVLVCSPVFAEFTRNYRRETLLSRELARRGLVVARIQYSGTANSDGDTSELTLDSMRDDARAAALHLMEDLGIGELALLGTRLGGVVAASVGSTLEGAPLVLWEPVADVSAYLQGVFRSKLMSDLKRGAREGVSSESLLEQMRSTGFVDILGYPIGRRFLDSLGRGELASEFAGRPRPILLVQFGGGRTDLRPEYRALVESWEGDGCRVKWEVFAGHETWWFADDSVDKTAVGAQPLIDLTAEWLFAQTSRAAS